MFHSTVRYYGVWGKEVRRGISREQQGRNSKDDINDLLGCRVTVHVGGSGGSRSYALRSINNTREKPWLWKQMVFTFSQLMGWLLNFLPNHHHTHYRVHLPWYYLGSFYFSLSLMVIYQTPVPTLIMGLTQEMGLCFFPNGPYGSEADPNPGSLGVTFSQMVTLASEVL